jgi:hypothetical protein
MKNKTHQQWLEYYLGLHPELVDIERQVRQVVKNTKKAVYPYQAAALYHCRSMAAKPWKLAQRMAIAVSIWPMRCQIVR